MTNIARKIKTADTGSSSATAALNPEMRQRLLGRMSAEGNSAPSVPFDRTLPLWRRKPLLVFGGAAASAAAFAVVFVPSLAKMHQQTTEGRQVGLALLQYTQNYDEKFSDWKKVSPERKAKFQDVNGSVSKLPNDISHYYELQRANELQQRNAGAVRGLRDVVDGSVPLINGLVAERQVHREGNVTVAVDKLESASDKVEQMVKSTGGYVASNDLTTDNDGYKSASLSVQVPVAQFDETLKQFASLGTVTAKSISGEDITERVSDSTQAELVLREAAETAARKLKNNEGSEKEIRYREADLRSVKIQLAQTQARLGLLRKRAKLSTINVSLTEKAKRAAQTPPSGFLGDLSETNRVASAAFAAAIRVPVVLIIWVLAFSPLWVSLALVYRYSARRNGQASAEV